MERYVAAFAVFFIGYAFGTLTKKCETPQKVTRNVVDTLFVPIEKLRIDTVYVPKYIKDVAVVERQTGCVESITETDTKIVVKERLFVPSIRSYETRAVLQPKRDRFYVSSSVVLLKVRPYADVRFGRTFFNTKVGTEIVLSNNGLGLGVRVNF